MLQRTMDAAFLNEVVNDPDVRPWVQGPPGPLDLAELLSNPRNIALVGDWGGFVYVQHEPGLYEVHSQLLPDGRAHSFAAARASLRFMFTQTDCAEVVTKVPDGNTAARGLTRSLGFRHNFDSLGASHWSFPLEAWRARDPELVQHGERFHATLEAAKAAVGSTMPTHPHDESHERAVGAALLMAEAGYVQKCCWSYNRWARLAGYQTILQLSETVIDVRDALVSVVGGRMEVLKCR